jgi:UDP-N-acetylglucosamine 2-epimerase (non-hydrolysing)
VRRADIVAGVLELIDDSGERARMARASNPYGDGRASERILRAVDHHFGLASTPPDPFVADGAAAGYPGAGIG